MTIVQKIDEINGNGAESSHEQEDTRVLGLAQFREVQACSTRGWNRKLQELYICVSPNRGKHHSPKLDVPIRSLE